MRVTRTSRSHEIPLPRRYVSQILRANDRGGRKAASRMRQRAVALVKTFLGRRQVYVSGGPAVVGRDRG
jgi:hypothetical protein